MFVVHNYAYCVYLYIAAWYILMQDYLDYG